MSLMITIINAIILKIHSVDTLTRIGLIVAVYLAIGFMLALATRIFSGEESGWAIFLLISFWPIILVGRIIAHLLVIIEFIAKGKVLDLMVWVLDLFSLPIAVLTFLGSITLIMKIPSMDVLIRIGLICAAYLVIGFAALFLGQFLYHAVGFGKKFFTVVFWPFALIAFATLLRLDKFLFLGESEDDEKREIGDRRNESEFAKVAAVILEGLGGKANVVSVDHCVTRLRIEIRDPAKVSERKIKSAGVSGVLRPEKTRIQVIIGNKARFVADELKRLR